MASNWSPLRGTGTQSWRTGASEGDAVFIHQNHRSWLRAVPRGASVFWHLLLIGL